MRQMPLFLFTHLQEFDVEPTRTVREEFYSVYNQQVKVSPSGQGQGGCAWGQQAASNEATRALEGDERHWHVWPGAQVMA